MKTRLLKLPPGALFHHDLHLMVFRPRGIVTRKRLDAVIKTLELAEDRDERQFNRFTDLSKLDAIDVDFSTMFRFSLHRRLAYSRRLPVKSAVYVTSSEAVRVAKIHALLTDFSALKVRLFDSVAAAAKWLDVSLETLELDPWSGLQNRPVAATKAKGRPSLSARSKPHARSTRNPKLQIPNNPQVLKSKSKEQHQTA